MTAINTELLNKITILYIEDDYETRKNLVHESAKLFKKVYAETNGLDGLNTYKANKDSIDVIVSDLHSSILSGSELLKEIRLIHKDIPFIFSTAHTELKHVLESIQHKTTECLTKPINIQYLFERVSFVYEESFLKQKNFHQKEESQRYLDAINKVAIVAKADLRGNITYANDIFCDIAQYQLEELIGKSHNIIRHPDTPSELFKKLWIDLQSGKTWQGKIKNRSKYGRTYYVNANISPIYDDLGKDIIEYIAIRFLTTNDELEKREFKKRVLANIQVNKKIHLEKVNHINILENKLKRYENVSGLEVVLKTERKKSATLVAQVNHYEKIITTLKNNHEKFIKSFNVKVRNTSDLSIVLTKENKKLEENLINIKDEVKNKKKDLRVANNRIDSQNKTIRDLRDVIDSLEKEAKDLKLNNFFDS